MSSYYQGSNTTGLIFALVLATSACEDNKPTADDEPTATASEPGSSQGRQPQSGKTSSDPLGQAKIDEPKTDGIKAESGSACLAGKYRFDYAEVPLQEVMDSVPGGADVKKQTGSANCTFEAAPKNSWSCTTTSPFEAEVKTEQAGMPMTMTIKMEGTAKMKYRLLEGDSFKVEGTDMADFKMGGVINLAGNEIALPTEQLPHSFGDEGTVWKFSCEGDALVLSSDIGTGKHLSYRLARIK